MPDFNAGWDGRGKSHSAVVVVDRAVDMATMIFDDPTAVTFRRGATVLDEQTVMATQTGSAQQQLGGEAGEPGQHPLMLLGTQGHPTLDDFNVKVGDRFQLFGANWRVVNVVSHVPGVVEAHCEGQQ